MNSGFFKWRMPNQSLPWSSPSAENYRFNINICQHPDSCAALPQQSRSETGAALAMFA